MLGRLFFMYRKPKLFFGLLFVAGLLNLTMSMAGSGSEKKEALTHEEDKQFDTNR